MLTRYRLAAGLGITVMLLVLARVVFWIGVAYQRGVFLSTHIYAFERYSTLLTTLSRQGREKDLCKLVNDFDRMWRIDLQSPQHVVAVINTLESEYVTAPAECISLTAPPPVPLKDGGSR